VFSYENVLTSLYQTFLLVYQITSICFFSVSVTQNRIKTFILQATSFVCGFKSLSGLIQEQRYRKTVHNTGEHVPDYTVSQTRRSECDCFTLFILLLLQHSLWHLHTWLLASMISRALIP